MDRFVAVSLVLGCVHLAMLAGIRPTATTAQEATPAAALNITVGQFAPIGEVVELLPGIDAAFLNEGQPANAPGQSLVLYRVILRDGILPPHVHPGATVLTVESGTLSSTLLAGRAWVTRPGAAPVEVTEPGTEIILQPGEGAWYNADMVHTSRAVGDEPAVVLLTSLWELGQPGFTVTNEQGTPMAMGTPAA